MTLHRITPKYVYPIMLIVIGGVYCYFLLKGQPHLLFFALILLLLFGILISKFSKLNQIYGLMIFLAPVSFSIDLPGGLSLKTPLEILLILIGFSYFFKTAFGWKSSQIEWKHILILLIGLDLLWTLVTTANSEHILISSKRFILKALFVFGFFFLFQLLTNQDRGKLYKLFGWGLLIPISIISINHGYYGFVQGASFDVSKPFFDDHTQYGACLAFVLPYFILHLKTQSKFNYLNFAITLVIICAVVLSYSRAAWISLIGALFMYFLLKIGVRFIPLLIILCSIILFVSYNFADYYDSLRNNEVKYGDDVTQHLSSVTNLQNDASNLERINRWVCAYRMFEAKPYVGYGPGTYQFVYDQFQTPEYMTRISTHGGDKGNAHSEFFNALSEQGLIGGLIQLLLMGCGVFLGMKNYFILSEEKDRKLLLSALLGLITFYIHGLFNTFSDIAEMSLLIYGSLVILMQYDNRNMKGNV